MCYRSFGGRWLRLSRPIRLFWVDGAFISVEKYAQLILVMDGFESPETVFITDEFVDEVEVNSRKIKLPELVIGSGTMDKYGIPLDPKEG